MKRAPLSTLLGRTALVLSGGGTNGAVEVGFYKALWEAGVKIDLIIGSSIGAINGALIATGMDPQRMHAHWRSARPRDFIKLNWREAWKGLGARSVFDGRRMRRFLELGIPARTFEELKIPFIAVATDLNTGDGIDLERGDLISAVQASCALPGLLPPIEIDGRLLADGGIMRWLPIDLAVARGATTTIICMSECLSDRYDPPRTAVDILNRAFSLAISRVARTPGYLDIFALRTRQIVFEPCFRIRITPQSIFDMGNTDIQVKFGYEYARARLDQAGLWHPPPATSGTMNP